MRSYVIYAWCIILSQYIMLLEPSIQNNSLCPERCTCMLVGKQLYVDCSGKGFSAVPEIHVSRESTVSIDLSQNNITDIHSTSFEPFTQVTHLNLSHNRLRFISPEAIAKLPLEELYLHRNPDLNAAHVTSLVRDLPDSLDFISLDASLLVEEEYVWPRDRLLGLLLYNEDNHFDPKYQPGLVESVHKLIIRGHNLEVIPPVIFTGVNTDEINVDLADHKIKSLIVLRSNIVINKLMINLKGNHIREITKFNTANYTNFTLSLDLSGNELNKFETDSFENIVNFGYVILDDNDISIESVQNILETLQSKKIDSLSLADCGINRNTEGYIPLSRNTFEKLKDTCLKSLDISRNKIYTIAHEVLNPLSCLKTLRMSDFVHPGALSYLPKLSVLSLHGILPEEARDLTEKYLPSQLQALELGDLQKQKSIQKLVIKNNSMIRRITVENSLQAMVEIELSDLPKLESLVIKDVDIKINNLHINNNMKQQFKKLIYNNNDKFEGTDLYDFFTNNFPVSIAKMSPLKLLDMSNNDFSFLEHQVLAKMIADLGFENLEILRLSNCQLSDTHFVPNFFDGGEKLTELDLSWNLIGHFRNGVLNKLRSLRKLYLQHNHITHIDPLNFEKMNDLQYLDMTNNRFTCDCEQREFINFVKGNQHRIIFHGRRTKCHPDSIGIGAYNTFLLHYTSPWIECDGNYIMILSFTIIFLVVIITCIFIFLYNYTSIRYRSALCKIKCNRWYSEIQLAVGRRQYKSLIGHQYDFDAYVIHHPTDISWILYELIPHVEKDQHFSFELCIEERNFLPGPFKTDNLARAILRSRRALLIISKDFLESSDGWFRLELEMAQLQHLNGREKYIIIIFLDEIPASQLPMKLKCLMGFTTSFVWPKNRSKRNKFWRGLLLELNIKPNIDGIGGALNHSHCTAHCAECKGKFLHKSLKLHPRRCYSENGSGTIYV